MLQHTEQLDTLFEAILELSSIEECYDFFEDLCTVKEILDMSQRLRAAVELANGRSYQRIAEEVGISSATIGRVSRCLFYGSGGYQAAIRRLKESGRVRDEAGAQ